MDCFNEKMQAHIKKYFSYPERAAENGSQGQVSVQFFIDKDGTKEVIPSGNYNNPAGGSPIYFISFFKL